MGIFGRRGKYGAQPVPVPVPVPTIDNSTHGVPYRVGDDVQVGSESLGRAQIDCCYRSSRSRWGQYGQGVAARQAGALYFDMVFHQPSDCLLEDAEVHLKFTSLSCLHNASTPTLTTPAIGSAVVMPATATSAMLDTPVKGQSTVQVSEWFGPKSLRRELAHHVGNKTTQMQPEFSLGVAGQSASVGGVGTSKTTETEEIRRWELWARMVASSDSAGLYDTLVWQWQGNPFKTDLMPRLPFKSGMVLYHNNAPFVVSLEIRGKLQGPTGGWVKSKPTRFPREISPEPSTEDLETIARSLHEQMLAANEENQA